MTDSTQNSPARPPVQWTAPSVIVATGLWAGRLPWIPGTWGALWGLPLTWAISKIPWWEGQIVVIVWLCLIGIPLCTAAVRKFGGVKDPGAIVFDEIASMPIVFLGVPSLIVQQPSILVIGFLLHRLFDIVKPPPIRWIERLPEGLGIMADDWAAAAFACIVLHDLHWLGVLNWIWG